MRVRLKLKLAEIVEGVDLSSYAEGDIINLVEWEAAILIAGEYAEPIATEERVSRAPALRPAIAADRSSDELD